MAGKKTTIELKALTDKVVKAITDNFQVDEIVLFGSYARGAANDLSDVDIAVVCPELKEGQAMFKNVLTVTRKSGLCEPYLQLLAFPSKTYYNEESYVDPDFIREIKKTGKVLFSRNIALSSPSGLV